MSRPAEAVRGAVSLRDDAASGVLWSVAQKWTMRLGGLVTVAILARLLSPEEFGLVALATAFVPVLYLLADLGFTTYVVQADDVSDRTLSTAFWYAVAAGSALGLLLLLVAAPLARSLGHPDLAPVLAALAPTVLLVALSSVPIALLRRRFAFRALAVQSFVAGAAGQVLAVAMALSGAGVWALVAQFLVNQLVVGVLAWHLSRFRPRCTFSREQFLLMGRFGVKVIAVELVALTRAWAEAAVVTAALGVTGLGYLNIAQRLVQAAQDLSAAAVVPVSTVVFARVRDVTERLAAAYTRATETVYLLVMPVMAGLAVAAPLLLPLAFGDQWLHSVAPAQALAVAGVLTLGASLDNGLLYGTGRPGRWLVYALAVDGLTVATTVYAVRFGLLGVALGFIGVAVLATVLRWFMVAALLGSSVWTVARPFVTTGAVTLVGTTAGLATTVGSGRLPDLAELAAVGAVVVVVHVAAARLLLPEAYARTVALVRDRVRGRHARRDRAGTAPQDGAPQHPVTAVAVTPSSVRPEE